MLTKKSNGTKTRYKCYFCEHTCTSALSRAMHISSVHGFTGVLDYSHCPCGWKSGGMTPKLTVHHLLEQDDIEAHLEEHMDKLLNAAMLQLAGVDKGGEK